LTDDGFKFVLLDTPTQVHIILKKFIEQQPPTIIVELIKLIFNLALAQYEATYKLKTKTQEIINIVKQDFDQMGLVEFVEYEQTGKSKKEYEYFYITKLMQSFLLTQIGSKD
jgi:hypothetical protein